MKGIILAGGSGTRLYPLTLTISKQLLPVYDKPMIFYPLSTLMLAGIKDILIISTPNDLPKFRELLGDGSSYGIKLSYEVQPSPDGLAQAFIIGEKFIDGDACAMILGDNIFYGNGLSRHLQRAAGQANGATIFGYYVDDPERFGIIEFDKNNNVLTIEEKPQKPKSNYAATGLYVCKNNLLKEIDSLKKSPRGEYEFTDVIAGQVERGLAKVCPLPSECAYLDTGTFDSLLECSILIKEYEKENGLYGAVELDLYKLGKITKEEFEGAISIYAKDYRERLNKML